MDTGLWLDKARNVIEQLPAGKKFELRNLFQELEWEDLPKGDRISFGKYFKNEVLEKRIANVEFINRKKNNHAQYIKLEKEET